MYTGYRSGSIFITKMAPLLASSESHRACDWRWHERGRERGRVRGREGGREREREREHVRGNHE